LHLRCKSYSIASIAVNRRNRRRRRFRHERPSGAPQRFTEFEQVVPTTRRRFPKVFRRGLTRPSPSARSRSSSLRAFVLSGISVFFSATQGFFAPAQFRKQLQAYRVTAPTRGRGRTKCPRWAVGQPPTTIDRDECPPPVGTTPTEAASAPEHEAFDATSLAPRRKTLHHLGPGSAPQRARRVGTQTVR
jgi:hypothetical protein